MLVRLRHWLINQGAELLNRGAERWRVARDVSYGADPLQKLDIYAPAVKPHNTPVVVLIHGGSWQHESKDQIRFAAAELAQAGCVVALINYRLYPPAVFPAFIEDGAQAVAWTATHIADYGGDPKRLVLMGHSSGAHIAAMLGVEPSYVHGAKLAPSVIRGIIGVAGPYDFKVSGNFAKIFSGDPNQYLPGRIAMRSGSKLPFLLLHGRLDFVVSYKNSTRMATALLNHDGKARLVLSRKAEHLTMMAAMHPKLRWIAPTYRETLAFIDDVTQ